MLLKLSGLFLLFWSLVFGMGYHVTRGKNTVIAQYSEKIKSHTYFNRKLQTGLYELSRKFYDYQNKEIALSYRVDENHYQQSMSEFGIQPEKCALFTKDALIKVINKVKKEYGLIFEIQFSVGSDGNLNWKYQYKYKNEQDKKILSFLLDKIKYYAGKYRNYCFSQSGFYLKDNLFYPDFNWLHKKNAVRLSSLYQALYEEARIRKYGEADFLNMVLAFCQEIPYRIPPNKIGNKYIAGLIPAPQVLVENWGDCDCKSALFSSLWDSYDRGGTALIRVPGHIFAAVRGTKKFSTEIQVNIDGVPYILLEPVGPGKLPAGLVSQFSREHLLARNYEIYTIN